MGKVWGGGETEIPPTLLNRKSPQQFTVGFPPISFLPSPYTYFCRRIMISGGGSFPVLPLKKASLGGTGERAISVVAPWLWNPLPEEVDVASSLLSLCMGMGPNPMGLNSPKSVLSASPHSDPVSGLQLWSRQEDRNRSRLNSFCWPGRHLPPLFLCHCPHVFPGLWEPT